MPQFGMKYRTSWERTGRARVVPGALFGARAEVEEVSEAWYEQAPGDPQKVRIGRHVRWRRARRSEILELVYATAGCGNVKASAPTSPPTPKPGR